MVHINRPLSVFIYFYVLSPNNYKAFCGIADSIVVCTLAGFTSGTTAQNFALKIPPTAFIFREQKF